MKNTRCQTRHSLTSGSNVTLFVYEGIVRPISVVTALVRGTIRRKQYEAYVRSTAHKYCYSASKGYPKRKQYEA